MNTIVSVLSSSIECKVLRFDKSEVLRIGGSISAHDCVRVMESCADVMGKLNEHGGFTKLLFECIIFKSAKLGLLSMLKLTEIYEFLKEHILVHYCMLL